MDRIIAKWIVVVTLLLAVGLGALIAFLQMG